MDIFIDLDGVLADFVTAAFEAHNTAVPNDETWPVGVYDIENILSVSKDHFWERIERYGSSFWASLAKYSWANSLLTKAREYGGVYIATKPARHPMCSAGKIEWMQTHLNPMFNNFIITPHKALLAAQGRVLIDDSDANCTAFEKHGGQAITFPQPWNHKRAYTSCRLEYVFHRLEALYRVGLD